MSTINQLLHLFGREVIIDSCVKSLLAQKMEFKKGVVLFHTDNNVLSGIVKLVK